MKQRGLEFLEMLIIDPEALHETQIPPLASILSNFLVSTESKDELRILCLKIAKKCSLSDGFCEHFLRYISQSETSTLINTHNIPIKQKLIDLLMEVFRDEKRAAYLTPKISVSIMSSFSSSFHNQTSQMWLKVLFILLKSSHDFRKEFMRFGGLKVILNLLKIPHMDIVFQAVRVLKTLAAHGIIKEAQYGNSTRQQLIHLLGGAKYDYEQRQLADHAKKTLEIARNEAAAALNISPSRPSARGKMLDKIQNKIEEKRNTEEDKLMVKHPSQKATAEVKRHKIKNILDGSNGKGTKQNQNPIKQIPISKPKKLNGKKQSGKQKASSPNKLLSHPKQSVTILPVVIQAPPPPVEEEILSEAEGDYENDSAWKIKLDNILESVAACSVDHFNNYGTLISLQKLVIQKSKTLSS